MMSVSSECCAYGCRNRPDYKVPGITFHVFPKDPVRRKAWIEAVREKNIPNFEPLDYTKICSEHFAEECFDRSKKRVFLLAHAVPTIFGSPKNIPDIRPSHPLTKIYSNGAVKRLLPESEDEDDVIFGQPFEDEDEYTKEDDSSSSESPLEESEPEETPETEVVYVSEEAMDNNKPSIIKVVPERPQPTVAVHNDIMKALEAYSKMKNNSNNGGEVSLVMLQPPTSPTEPTPQVLTPLQLVEFSPKVLTEMYERNIKDLKTARQKSRRYKAKIARLERIVRNFEKCGSSEEEDSEEELEQIGVDGVYEQLLRKQEGEGSEEGGSDVWKLEAGES